MTVLDSAGAFVVVRDVARGTVDVWDVKEQERTRLTDRGRSPSGNVVIDEAGDRAAVFGTSLVGFDAGDQRYLLDAGPVAARSLKRDKRAGVSWTSAGTGKRADLATPALPCAAVSGETVFSTPELVVTQTTYSSSYLMGELDGAAVRTRACVLPSGPVRVVDTRVDGNGTDFVGSATFEIVKGAGHFLLLFTHEEASEGEVLEDDWTLFDAAAGKRVDLWHGERDDSPASPETGDETYVRAVLTAGGQLGVAFGEKGAAKRLVGYNAAGKPTILESSDPFDEKSLRLDGTILHWANAGTEHTVDLAALPPQGNQ